MYFMLETRSDLAFSINKLAQYCASPTDRHWKEVKRILSVVKGSEEVKRILENREQCGIPKAMVVGYFDCAYMDDTNDRHLTMAYIFFMARSPVSWYSKKQIVGALSTTEAEYLSGTEVMKDVVWFRLFLADLVVCMTKIIPVQLRGNNQSANALAKNPEYHAKRSIYTGVSASLQRWWNKVKLRFNISRLQK